MKFISKLLVLSSLLAVLNGSALAKETPVCECGQASDARIKSDTGSSFVSADPVKTSASTAR